MRCLSEFRPTPATIHPRSPAPDRDLRRQPFLVSLPVRVRIHMGDRKTPPLVALQLSLEFLRQCSRVPGRLIHRKIMALACNDDIAELLFFAFLGPVGAGPVRPPVIAACSLAIACRQYLPIASPDIGYQIIVPLERPSGGTIDMYD